MDGRVHRAGSLKVSIDGKVVATSTMKASTTEYKYTAAHIAGLDARDSCAGGGAGGRLGRRRLYTGDRSLPQGKHNVLDTSEIPAGDSANSVWGSSLSNERRRQSGGELGSGHRRIRRDSGGTSTENGIDGRYGRPRGAGVGLPSPSDGGNFGYLIPNLSPGVAYNVRLDFAETYYWRPTMRRFDVTINNTLVLQDFDVFTAAGGKDKGDFRKCSQGQRGRTMIRGRIAIAFYQRQSG